MTLFRKSRVGTIRRHRCQACGKSVGVSWRSGLFSGAIGITPPLLLASSLWLQPSQALLSFPFLVEGDRGIWLFGIAALVVGLLGGVLQTGLLTLLAPLIKK